MASGYFPLDHRDVEHGKALSDALDAVEAALTVGYDDNQSDNAAADGGALAQLAIAANLIYQNLDFWRQEDCAHPSHKYDRRCRAYRYYPGQGITEMRCNLCDKATVAK